MIYSNSKENWGITVLTENEQKEPLEVSQISITMLGGKMWTGTINDFMAQIKILQNASFYIRLNDKHNLEVCKKEIDAHLQLHLNPQS